MPSDRVKRTKGKPAALCVKYSRPAPNGPSVYTNTSRSGSSGRSTPLSCTCSQSSQSPIPILNTPIISDLASSTQPVIRPQPRIQVSSLLAETNNRYETWRMDSLLATERFQDISSRNWARTCQDCGIWCNVLVASGHNATNYCAIDCQRPLWQFHRSVRDDFYNCDLLQEDLCFTEMENCLFLSLISLSTKMTARPQTLGRSSEGARLTILQCFMVILSLLSNSWRTCKEI